VRSGQWGETDGGGDVKVHQQKLKVVYLPAEGQTLPEEDEGPPDVGPAMGAHESVSPFLMRFVHSR
jgi:hypothetical protein